MKYYKDKNGGVLALAADDSDNDFIKPSMVLMTQAEVDAHLNPPKTPEQIQEEVNQEALAYLASTDWYVIRLTETSIAVPQAILDERARVRLLVI